jgi:hypothetical protein
MADERRVIRHPSLERYFVRPATRRAATSEDGGASCATNRSDRRGTRRTLTVALHSDCVDNLSSTGHAIERGRERSGGERGCNHGVTAGAIGEPAVPESSILDAHG